MLAKQSVAVGVLAWACLFGAAFAGPAVAQPNEPGQPPPVPESPQEPSAAAESGRPADSPPAAESGQPANLPPAADPGQSADPSAEPDAAQPPDPSPAPDSGQPVDSLPEPGADPSAFPPTQGVPPVSDPGSISGTPDSGPTSPPGRDTSPDTSLTPTPGPDTTRTNDPQDTEGALNLTQEQRRLIQWGLAAVGYDPGEKDGVFGRETRARIRSWQTSRGKEATGYLDRLEAVELELRGGNLRDRENERAENDARFNDAQHTADRMQGERDEAVAGREQTEQWAARWIVTTVAGAAVVLFLLGVVGYRSVARARQRRARAELLAQAARSDLADRDARDRAAGAVPAVFLDGADPDGRPIAVRVPGTAIAGAEGAVVGRNPFDSAVVLDHPEVSRRHFRLSASGASVLVEDLNSMNGTKLNDVELAPGAGVPLLPGAVLQIGDLSFTVTLQSGIRTPMSTADQSL